MKLRLLGLGAMILLASWGCGDGGGTEHTGVGPQDGQGGAQNGGSAGLASGGENASGGSTAGTDGAGGSAQGGSTGNGGSAGSPGTGGVAAAGGTAGSSAAAGSAGTAGSLNVAGTTGFPPDPPQQSANKLDLLFVVDNSISMRNQQLVLSRSVGTFLRRLENPLCLEADGTPSVQQPASSAEGCPSGAEREFSPVRDVHIGVITTSLGARGGQVCTDVDGTDDDRAQLLPSVRAGLNSYDGRGFLKWDPDQIATPPGESNVDVVVADLSAQIDAANTVGCGYEHSLEAWYQFLVDPEPTTNIVTTNNVSAPVDVNQTVLDQRAAFLRPDSAVAIVLLTDENDCSIRGDGLGWLIGLSQAGGRPFTMPRSTEACKTDANSPCCRSCASVEAAPPSGCLALANDPECLINGGNLDNTAGVAEDQLNLRCWDQKRRFGFDLLYPIERYTAGLTHVAVFNRQGVLVQNPLFSAGRNPSLVSFALIAGIPWQDISADPPGNEPSYLSADELTAEGRWPLILGDPTSGVPPADPLMRETPNERSGVSPLIGPIVPSSSQDPTANAANGHETTNLDNTELQYSCIYELPQPVVCSTPECDCGPGSELCNRPVCQPPEGGPAGGTQYYGKAFPPLRPVALAKSLGKQAVLGSICARNTSDHLAPDYAFNAEFNALARRLGVMLVE